MGVDELIREMRLGEIGGRVVSVSKACLLRRLKKAPGIRRFVESLAWRNAAMRSGESTIQLVTLPGVAIAGNDRSD